MAWINDFLGKVGLGEVAKLYENSKDELPQEFDIEKAAKDYLDSRVAIFKSSDEFKNAIKEREIVAIKQLRKQINDDLGIGLSGEEAATIDLAEFTKKAKTKFETEIQEARNGKSSEWQEKYSTIQKEFDGFKKLHETELGNWEKKYKDLETKAEREQREQNRNNLFNQVFDKLDFGEDKAHRENAKIIVKARMSELGWNFTDDGTKLFKGENDVVTSNDGHSIIKDLETGIKYIAEERKLFPQANTGNKGGYNPGEPTKTGNKEIDDLVQLQMSELAKINNMGKK